jgi:hypothetical protein
MEGEVFTFKEGFMIMVAFLLLLCIPIIADGASKHEIKDEDEEEK